MDLTRINEKQLLEMAALAAEVCCVELVGEIIKGEKMSIGTYIGCAFTCELGEGTFVVSEKSAGTLIVNDQIVFCANQFKIVDMIKTICQ